MSFSRMYDVLAIFLSAVCVLHCILMPLVIALTPFVMMTQMQLLWDNYHAWLLLAVVPITLVGLSQGYRRHRDARVWSIGLAGLGSMAIGILFHAIPWVEAVLVAGGAMLIACAHWINWRQVCPDGCHSVNPGFKSKLFKAPQH